MLGTAGTVWEVGTVWVVVTQFKLSLSVHISPQGTPLSPRQTIEGRWFEVDKLQSGVDALMHNVSCHFHSTARGRVVLCLLVHRHNVFWPASISWKILLDSRKSYIRHWLTVDVDVKNRCTWTHTWYVIFMMHVSRPPNGNQHAVGCPAQTFQRRPAHHFVHTMHERKNCRNPQSGTWTYHAKFNQTTCLGMPQHH